MNISIPLNTEPREVACEPGLVVDLASTGAGMLPLVGGKAANLGEMIRAGLPVPPGVCVTTEAYRRVADAVTIDFAGMARTGPAGMPRFARDARAAILEARIPNDVAEAIVEAYHTMGGYTPVAVRSSATAEDLPNASFAGQQDTYLHVIGATAVLDAVRRCWASLWTDRAAVYRATNGIDHRTVRIAVVVQRMVDAEVAGVLFTANPVTGRRRQAVIDASPGLGEAVVSGVVNPDHFVVDTEGGQILERRLGDKRVEVCSLPDGGTRLVERAPSAGRACLTDEQLRKLAQLGGRVEAYYGAPQDTEWAYDVEGKLWLTQARPITTLFPVPAGARAADLRVYLCFSLAQGLYRPITPMGLAAFRVAASGAARLIGIPVDDALNGPPVFAEAAQRVFVDLTSTLRGPVGRRLMPKVLGVMEARSAAVIQALLEDARLAPSGKSPAQFVRRILRIAVQYGVPLRFLEALARPEAARARVARRGKKLRSRLAVRAGASSTERLDFAERVLAQEVAPLIPCELPACAAGFAMLALASKLLGQDASETEMQSVLRGLPYNVTTEMDLALWDLACRIRQDPDAAAAFRQRAPEDLSSRFLNGELPKAAQRGLSQFLARYGHRAVAEIDIGIPRWSDDPTHILGVLVNYLRSHDPKAAPSALFESGAAAAEEMIETLAARAAKRGWWRGWLVRFALRRARQLCGLREIGKYDAIVVLSAVRRELKQVGADLVRRGRLEFADDIFFLDLRETRFALGGRDVRPLVRERKQAYETELRRRHVPRILLSDGTEPEAEFTSAAAAGALTGTPASAGSITGIARVILDPVGAHLEPGEILVAPSTDPGWTPLFLTAGGLVMEMGGANSHGAVVAREYGIPAVVGVAGATARIQTGQRIQVDGSSGVITTLAP